MQGFYYFFFCDCEFKSDDFSRYEKNRHKILMLNTCKASNVTGRMDNDFLLFKSPTFSWLYVM